MSNMLPPDELNVLVSWVQQGADKVKYETAIKPIIEKRCLSCHDGSNPHLANLNGLDNLKKVTEQDTGTDIFTLVRVSHIHLFGLTFIFYLVGTIFSHAFWRPVWLKAAIVALPFLCLAVDVISWYLVKLYHPFAFVTMGAGALQGLCFAFMWVVSMYQLWFSGTPAAVERRHGVDEIAVG
ncbi:MAG: elongation factor-1 alpha [Betaproteobacteria bacterium]|nr:MAG: elongation factor-1 alpha [Betaproteobacteria bacterium]